MHDRLQPADGVGKKLALGQLINRFIVGQLEHYIDRLPIEIKGEENLQEFVDHLRRGGSGVLSPNHMTMLDPMLVASIVKAKLSVSDLPEQPRQMVILSSKFFPDLYSELIKDKKLRSRKSVIKGLMKHFFQAMRFEGGIIHTSGEMEGIDFVPMVQHYRMGKREFRRYNSHIDGESFRQIEEAILTGSIILGVSIEGTRSNGLAPAQSGIFRIFRNLQVEDKTLMMPIAIQGIRRRPWDKKTPVVVHFGKPVSHDEIVSDAAKYGLTPPDVLILQTAGMLPDEMHGYYGGKEFQEYLAYCREQMLPPSGVVYERAGTSKV